MTAVLRVKTLHNLDKPPKIHDGQWEWKDNCDFMFYHPPETWHEVWEKPDYYMRLFVCKLH